MPMPLPCPSDAPLAVQLNGQALAWTPGLTVAAALEQGAYAADAVATAVNGEFVPRGQRGGTALQPGDQLTVFTAIVGG
jgi:sulfur carrier protein